MAPEPEEFTCVSSDPVSQLLLRGRAQTLREAEELECTESRLRDLNPGLPLYESGALPLS
jgi:hypothetical protein